MAFRIKPADNFGGFTIIELMVCAVLLSILALAVVPVSQLHRQHIKEQELRLALTQLRSAIDTYKKATDEKQIAKLANESGYPKDLEALLTIYKNSKDSNDSAAGIRFIRKIPRDPMNRNLDVDASQTWGLRSFKSSATDPKQGEDVFDVYSLSPSAGLNGIAYRDW